MSRTTCAVASRRRRKRIMKAAKGYWGDRKNHIRLSRDAVRRAMANSFAHRKKKKGDFRRLWITRIGIASKMHGVSYSKFINGLKRAGCELNRKVLADLAVCDPIAFGAVVDEAKKALAK